MTNVLEMDQAAELNLADLEIMELQTEDAFGIPDLGASHANSLSCTSLCCIIVL